ncbi:hypothetical protein VZT92_008834 [Zoarces viviparus]|uniref:Uncharacterized protein n=1 Tax=Zoarces viviparus TaxID=48416 RepID=A0AAW1FHL7_ZOAVI
MRRRTALSSPFKRQLTGSLSRTNGVPPVEEQLISNGARQRERRRVSRQGLISRAVGDSSRSNVSTPTLEGHNNEHGHHPFRDLLLLRLTGWPLLR